MQFAGFCWFLARRELSEDHGVTNTVVPQCQGLLNTGNAAGVVGETLDLRICTKSYLHNGFQQLHNFDTQHSRI